MCLTMPYAAKAAITVLIIILLVLLLLYLALGFLFFFIALGSKRREDETIPCKNSLFERNKDNINLVNGYKWYDTTYHQEVTIKSRKGLTLHGVEFRNPSNSNIWVITLHGWTNVKREMSSYAMDFYRRGFNVLIPDLRGHGNSESKFVSMGWLDRLDVVDWIESIVKENPKAKIIIHGTSMGGATTMMTTGENLPENVVLAIEDCGFTSVKDIFTDQAERKYHLPPKLVVPVASFVCKLMNGFFFGEASAVEQLKKSKTPTLFIHGDQDNFVLPSNLDPVYNACAAPKEKHIIHGAEHAVSAYWYHDEYWQTIDAFLEKYLYTVKN
ncbi:MAG: alpha/beta hydrolase [Oscillospiraceae bacterium]|nr:alpha/beta hydrolase [Oscillospiraceae bacterium]